MNVQDTMTVREKIIYFQFPLRASLFSSYGMILISENATRPCEMLECCRLTIQDILLQWIRLNTYLSCISLFFLFFSWRAPRRIFPVREFRNCSLFMESNHGGGGGGRFDSLGIYRFYIVPRHANPRLLKLLRFQFCFSISNRKWNKQRKRFPLACVQKEAEKFHIPTLNFVFLKNFHTRPLH